MLCYVIAANAFLLSVGKLHLAKEWKGMGTQKVAMYVLRGHHSLFQSPFACSCASGRA